MKAGDTYRLEGYLGDTAYGLVTFMDGKWKLVVNDGDIYPWPLSEAETHWDKTTLVREGETRDEA